MALTNTQIQCGDMYTVQYELHYKRENMTADGRGQGRPATGAGADI
jgi:hypothetical protein